MPLCKSDRSRAGRFILRNYYDRRNLRAGKALEMIPFGGSLRSYLFISFGEAFQHCGCPGVSPFPEILFHRSGGGRRHLSVCT